MRNRLLELCMTKNINTVDEVVNLIGINRDDAVALLNKDNNAIIKEETINKCLKYFDCSFEYFTCLVD